MTTLSYDVSGRVGMIVIGVMAVPVAALLLMLAAAPAPEVVVPRPHAVEQHGTSALTARLAIRQCGNGLKVYDCPETPEHAPVFIYVCESVGGTDCAGVIVGSRGVEFTAWVGSCDRWDELTAACSSTKVSDVPIAVLGVLKGDEDD